MLLIDMLCLTHEVSDGLVNGTLKVEYIQDMHFETREQAQQAIVELCTRLSAVKSQVAAGGWCFGFLP